MYEHVAHVAALRHFVSRCTTMDVCALHFRVVAATGGFVAAAAPCCNPITRPHVGISRNVVFSRSNSKTCGDDCIPLGMYIDTRYRYILCEFQLNRISVLRLVAVARGFSSFDAYCMKLAVVQKQNGNCTSFENFEISENLEHSHQPIYIWRHKRKCFSLAPTGRTATNDEQSRTM